MVCEVERVPALKTVTLWPGVSTNVVSPAELVASTAVGVSMMTVPGWPEAGGM